MTEPLSVCGPGKELVFLATDDSVCESLGAARAPQGGCAMEFTPDTPSKPDLRWSHDGSYRVAVCAPTNTSETSRTTTEQISESLEQTVDFYFTSGRNFAADIHWSSDTDSKKFEQSNATVHMTARSSQGESNLISILSKLGTKAQS